MELYYFLCKSAATGGLVPYKNVAHIIHHINLKPTGYVKWMCHLHLHYQLLMILYIVNMYVRTCLVSLGPQKVLYQRSHNHATLDNEARDDYYNGIHASIVLKLHMKYQCCNHAITACCFTRPRIGYYLPILSYHAAIYICISLAHYGAFNPNVLACLFMQIYILCFVSSSTYLLNFISLCCFLFSFISS